MQTMAWLRLRREGFTPRWDECGDVTLEFQTEQPDPTSGEPSTTSPDSADYWRMTPREVDELTDAEYRAFVRFANQRDPGRQPGRPPTMR